MDREGEYCIVVFFLCTTELSVNNFQFLFVKYAFNHSQDQLVLGSQPDGI